MAAFLKSQNMMKLKRKPSSTPARGGGAFLRGDSPRRGISDEDFNKRMDEIDWTDHQTNTKIKVTGSRVVLD